MLSVGTCNSAVCVKGSLKVTENEVLKGMSGDKERGRRGGGDAEKGRTEKLRICTLDKI